MIIGRDYYLGVLVEINLKNFPYSATSPVSLFLPNMSDSSSLQNTEDALERSVQLTVLNKMGIHARPAAMIVRIANRFPNTELWVRSKEEQINGKSIMGLMMLAAAQGTQLEVTAIGPDATTLIEELKFIFENKFDEA